MAETAAAAIAAGGNRRPVGDGRIRRWHVPDAGLRSFEMPGQTDASGSHWTRHAAQWGRVGSPLRPVAEDADLYWRVIASSVAASKLAAARVLLLGVTPELTSLPWPRQSSLLACDLSLDMLRSIWPLGRFPGVSAGALNANWLALPLTAGACSLIVGDGSLSVFDQAADYRRGARELHRVLEPDGCLVLRLYCQPAVPESPEQVFADLRLGRVGNFHAFKWRLVMAIHADDANARLADIWACWEREFPDPEKVAALSGWPLETIRTLEAYRNASARYSFHTMDEVRSMLSPEFEILAAAWPRYELGERCPIASFRRRGA
jgi:SAM-dependent methyltransferase